MKDQLNKQKIRAWMIVPALFFAFAMGAAADTVTPSVFLEFAFSDVGTPATGCQPADPSGAFCIPSSGTATSFLGAPPWTISLPSQGGELTVTDAFLAGGSVPDIRFRHVHWAHVSCHSAQPIAATIR